MNYLTFPSRVWEPGEVVNGKQLWYSRSPTRDDWKRRRDLEMSFLRRILEKADAET